MDSIKGYVEHIVYRNEDNGYTVFHLENDDGEMTCVGNFHYIEEGELLKLDGEYTTHKMYGLQFAVESSEVCEPEDLVSIERYLGSGAIKGVGTALAGRIVRKFKEDTFRIIEEEPERLAEIKGISERKAREIAAQAEEKKDMRQAMIYLQKYGISTTLAAKIYQHYGRNVYRVIEENPYQLADHVSGVGFKTADEIASKVGIHTDSDYRIRSGIFYTLMQSVNEGHIYLRQNVLLYRAGELLGVEIPDMEKYLMDLAMEKKIVMKQAEDGNRIYASRYYYMELNVARMLHDLNISCDVAEDHMNRRIQAIEDNTGLHLDEIQRKAVVEAARRGIMVLTGGPGTGKTTTINAMIHFFESEGMDIYLAAPTGRAAKRMTEATGYEAQTIHRLLEVSGNPEDENIGGFQRNAENPLEADVVIIDEMSMVDLPLMYALLGAIMPGTRLILVGDRNQLPSVGPGSVLKDIIDSGCFPVVMLTKIFRQAGESDIVVNAHKINRGEEVVLDNKSRDFFFLKRQDPNMIISNVITLIQKKLPKYVDARPYDIQVLTPMRKGVLGVERLNRILQEYLNPPEAGKKEKEYSDRIFREGDKVMQIKNNYQLEWEISTRYGMTIDKGLGVFNGDMGIVREINTYEETVTVEYDEKKKVKYPYHLLEELELAYAVTIHKSQGSEYPAVVIPLLQGPRQLYHRNLLYTAVTRARKCVTLVGSDTVFQDMIHNTNEQNRNTSLAERIREIG
ncbi:MAG: ATP-dependent RecD-like DNA helicase [Dorea sp.]|nr:ATP-dependent RecD-like DNA helicase [Dorea sp.]